MDIVFLYYSLETGGAERVITSLANRFSDDGHNVSIIVLKDTEKSYMLNEKVRVIPIKASNVKHISSKIFWLMSLRNIINKIRPNVIIAFSAELAFLAKTSTFGTRIRVIGSERAATKFSLASFKKRTLLIAVSILCDGYIFLTERGMLAYPKIVSRKATVIPNAVFVKPRSDIAMNDSKSYKALSVGRLTKGKDFCTLIKAFAKFNQNYPQYQLDIYGEGPELNNLLDLIEQLEMKDVINLKGHVSEISVIMGGYDLFIFTSRSEGMPNSLIEALAFGLPTISTDCDFGPSELIKNGHNGLLVPVGDIDKIVSAMSMVTEDKVLSDKLKKNAKEINNSHSENSIYVKYNKYIQDVVKSEAR